MASDVLESGRQFLLDAAKLKHITIACDKDVDGLTSGTIMLRALEKMGSKNVRIFPAHKGEHAHSDSMRTRLSASHPEVLIVTDMGARPEPILPGIPTLIVDHHLPKGYPPGALVVSAWTAAPVPSSSVLAYILVEGICDAADLEWLAVLGGIADLADGVPYPDFAAARKKAGAKNVTETIALLNAARRSSRDEVEAALTMLRAASSPRDIATSESPDVETLRECRREVSEELKKNFKLAPKFSKTEKVALIRVSSPTQIHPLLATRWAGTLKKYMVMAANDAYIPGRVIFSMRTQSDAHLIEFLHTVAPELSEEFGYGHRQATAGNLSVENFEKLLGKMGFEAMK